MQDLQISIGDDTELVQIGEVSGIVQVLGKCSYLKKKKKPQKHEQKWKQLRNIKKYSYILCLFNCPWEAALNICLLWKFSWELLTIFFLNFC